MRKTLLILWVSFLLTPVMVFAECTTRGFTVIFVNGMLTDEVKAQKEQTSLKKILGEKFKGEELTVQKGYNPTHLAGAADAVQSVFQAFNNPVSEFDLNTILMQIHPQVTTRKILLLGHSQGSFYVNEMYEYLVGHGVPRESIAVYHIATPASYVAGGGQYVTSTNDKAMNYVRTHEIGANVGIHLNTYYVAGNTVNSALRANITIPKGAGYEEDGWGGHHFDTYMEGAAGRIVSDISAELSHLKVSDTASSTEGCFTPPVSDITYKMQAAAFNVLDPLAGNIRGVNNLIKKTASGLFSSFSNIFTPTISVSTNSAQVAAASVSVNTKEQPAPQVTAPTPSQNTPKETVLVVRTPPSPVETPQKTETSAPKDPIIPSVTNAPINPWPGYGGGGGAVIVPSTQIIETPVPMISLSALPEDGSVFATTTILFSGNTAADALVAIQMDADLSTTTADSSGAWSLPLTLFEGRHTVSVQAESSDVHSDSISRTITIDTTPPEIPILTISDCDHSIVAGMCVLARPDTNLSWSSAGATSYAMVRNNVLGTASNETSGTGILTENASTSFAVVAYDAAGNAATSTGIEVGSVLHPIIINEISWAGNDISASNQWIELKNQTPYQIDLSNFSISRSGGDSIALTGTIQPNNYAILEPFDIQYTGINKIIVPFLPLASTGEQLSLMFDGTMIDSTPAIETCGGWCAGGVNVQLGSNVSGLNDLSSSLSMERTKNTPDGSFAASWHSTDGYGGWLGTGAALWGTPGQENSEGWPEAGVVCNGSGPVEANRPLHLGASCIYLSRFITGSTYGAVRYAGLYRGVPGNATGGANSMGKALAKEFSTDVIDPQAGEQFFFVIYEIRNWADGDAPQFAAFFTDGSSPAPHGNYLIVPFTYETSSS